MDYHITRHHEAAVALFREAAGGSGAALRVAELPRGDVAGSIRVGSEEHKALFCRMLLDTMTGSEAAGIDLTFAELLDLCLAENERRLAVYDRRLLRPATLPPLARLVREVMRSRGPLGR